MRYSQMFQRTVRDVSQLEVSKNAQLLTRAGYVHQLMAGVYSFLPLGTRVLFKIEDIIRQEMNNISGQEIFMPALHPREIWDKTGRWEGLDVLFRIKGAGDRDLALGATHEEVVTPLAASIIQSYKDMPKAVYQIQTKFRNEPRAKSGLLRGREFRMKDLYSFHIKQEDLDQYYDKAIDAYLNVYRRCGLGEITLVTFASGGTFSNYSHEFQTITDSGEDMVYRIPGTTTAINEEIIGDKEALRGIIPNYQDGDEAKLEKVKAVEVGNIFKLGTKYSSAFDFTYTDRDGSRKAPIMGCYGIGSSRLMGAVAECLGDEHGLVWPEEIAPFRVAVLNLRSNDIACTEAATKAYLDMTTNGVDVLYDDRDVSAGEKFAEMDLLGIPWQCIIGPKGLEKGTAEWKYRATGEKRELPLGEQPF